jgi:D-amino peptidase
MRICIMTDIEGTAGVSSFEGQTYPAAKYLDDCRKLAMAEVNAAVDGFLEAGATDILIVDGHGCGGLWYEHMHPEAKMLHGRPGPPRSVTDPIISKYDATAIVGQHAMAGVPTSTLNHTQSSKAIDYIKLNGRLIGEIAQWALYWGSYGIPMIYLTGEDDACKEASEFVPGIHTVSVKQGLSRQAAISVSKEKARTLIRAGAKEALQQHKSKPVAPLVWPGPFTVEKRYFHTENADGYDRHPSAKRLDGQTVRITGEHIRDVIYA